MIGPPREAWRAAAVLVLLVLTGIVGLLLFLW